MTLERLVTLRQTFATTGSMDPADITDLLAAAVPSDIPWAQNIRVDFTASAVSGIGDYADSDHARIQGCEIIHLPVAP